MLLMVFGSIIIGPRDQNTLLIWTRLFVLFLEILLQSGSKSRAELVEVDSVYNQPKLIGIGSKGCTTAPSRMHGCTVYCVHCLTRPTSTCCDSNTVSASKINLDSLSQRAPLKSKSEPLTTAALKLKTFSTDSKSMENASGFFLSTHNRIYCSSL